MSKTSEFNDILDECLERVIKGEAVEACLAGYPEHVAELAPLLRTALDTRAAMAIRPRREFRERAGYQFQAAIQEMTPRESRGFFGWYPRWATVVTVVVVLLLAGSGTVVAASNSLPDNPLYPVKLATEAVQLAFTLSALDKAELYVELTDKRVDEIIKMADKGKVAQVEQATERLNEQLIAMADLAITAKGLMGETEAAMLEAPMPAAAEKALAPVPAPAPAPFEEAPPPMVELTPAPVTVTETPSFNEDTGRAVEKPVGPPGLRDIVSRRAAENSQALQDMLERVPESVKQALQDAIDVADAGYEQVLMNLD